MTKEELLEKIKSLKEDIKNVKGTPTECFSRVVGYLRPVQMWNKGKKEEFFMRKNHDIEHSSPSK